MTPNAPRGEAGPSHSEAHLPPLQEAREEEEEEFSPDITDGLPSIIYLLVSQRCDRRETAWSLTATCRAAYAVRHDPLLAADWLMHHHPAAPLHAAILGLSWPGALDQVLPILLRLGADVHAAVQVRPGRYALPYYTVHEISVSKYDGRSFPYEPTPQYSCSRVTALYLAALYGCAGAVRLLAAAGADARAGTSDHTISPLHIAVFNRHVDVVRVLLEAAPGVWDVLDGRGLTPFHFAAWAGPLDVMDMLLQAAARAGASHQRVVEVLTSADADSCTALEYAFRRGRHDVVRRLSEAGVDVRTALAPRGNAGMTLLDRATVGGDLGMVRALLACGADINRRNPENNGSTPLHSAVVNGREDVVSELLAAGADVHAALTQGGAMPLHMALRQPQSDILKLLLDAGAYPLVPDQEGLLPVFRAFVLDAPQHVAPLIRAMLA